VLRRAPSRRGEGAQEDAMPYRRHRQHGAQQRQVPRVDAPRRAEVGHAL
jgi:hypothetical protein